jgi:gliding motility-associated-like protein
MANNYLIVVLLFFKFSFGQVINSDCVESFELSNAENNSNFTYNAQNSITTESYYNVTDLNGEIKMKAGNFIVIKPDTFIKEGSLYLAKIEPCSECELNFSFLNFFTPNDDGYNDYWKVNWIEPVGFSQVSIYDRYGKLIKVLADINDTWDGKYNLNDVSSSDYWFKFMFVDCNGNSKEYKSHFSLKR